MIMDIFEIKLQELQQQLYQQEYIDSVLILREIIIGKQ
jgi:hypothetical protein